MTDITTIINGLNERFKNTVEAKSDMNFYELTYRYFDYIENTPSLKQILEESQKEYSQKHWEIWNKNKPTNEEDTREKRAETDKLERFNLYAVGSALYERIYFPINDYKNSSEDERGQDPVAIILLKGKVYAQSLANSKKIPYDKWSKKNIELYAQWFEEKRNYYETQLRSFHAILIDLFDRSKPEKVFLNYDQKMSILTVNGKSVSIQQKNDKPNAHYILKYLFENSEGLKAKSYYTEILEKEFSYQEDKDWRTLYRASKDINEKVLKQALVADFLVIKTGRTGYIEINPEYL